MYREDPLLPSHPESKYRDQWQDWSQFFGTSPRKGRARTKTLYSTLYEASQATQALGIKTKTDYKKRFYRDPCLPSNPDQVYFDKWTNWPQFFGKTLRQLYPTYMKARSAAKALGCNSSKEYLLHYQKNPHLPRNPNQKYKSQWRGWQDFLGFQKVEKYSTYREASLAAKQFSWRTQKEYLQNYAKDPRLPREPSKKYTTDWNGWPAFLGCSTKQYYNSFEAAKNSAIALGIASYTDYLNRYKIDPKLPSAPDVRYPKQWQGWTNFLLPSNAESLKLLKQACKVLSIKDSTHYRKLRESYKILPSHPERLEGWVNWYEFLDIPYPYTYEELQTLVIKNHCKTQADYKKLRIVLNDPRMPSSPEETYKGNGWTNFFDFFGKKRPNQVKYLKSEWSLWGDRITEFLKLARGAGTKANELCEFVNEYIEPNGLSKSPLEFLISNKINVQPFIDLLNRRTIPRKKKQLYSVKEFLDWVISTELTIEDPDTGEVTLVEGVRNPFQYLNFDDEPIPVTINETEKYALPYEYVKSSRDWIFSQNSPELQLSYSEQTHLHKFKADWYQIDSTFPLDPNDPDCVIKVEKGKTYIWLPIYWTYTYALMQLPARGRQIVYCDSGEMDSEIPIFKNGEVKWIPNAHPKAGATKQQGMIAKTRDGDFGVHYTSNKTQLFGEGYTIPYMPTELAYWLIKLRNWQMKYNPIASPTSWRSCQRTFLNEAQRKFKGENCFLFRELDDDEPGTFGGRLSTRLAAALFLANNDLDLATYDGKSPKETSDKLKDKQQITLTKFASKYTPHAMRVSLINAYNYEFGLPIEFIAKLVGHSSIVMSIYYLKSEKSGLNVRERMQTSEKEALKNSVETTRRFIEQQRIEDVRSTLTASNSDFLNSLTNERAAGNYVFKDFGICPVGSGYCDVGGDPVASKAKVHHPVPSGHLGDQNCIQCRFFVTGPAFLVGLVALFNEISLSVYTLAERYNRLNKELCTTTQRIEVISSQQYEDQKYSVQNSALSAEKEKLKSYRRKLNSEIETKAKKLDFLLSDLNALHLQVTRCKSLIRKCSEFEQSNKLQLMVPRELSINLQIEDCSYFQQLSEVCENAELFHSCNDDLAIARRSQALDKLMLNNNLSPKMMFLSEEEQLKIGNQFTQLMFNRLKSWEKIDRLLDGKMTLRDLRINERITTEDIESFFAKAKSFRIDAPKEA